MIDIEINRTDTNVMSLDDELRSALGELVYGLTARSDGLTIHMADDATSKQLARARQIVQEHDPSQLSPSQQEQVMRKTRLEQLRQADQPLDADGLGNTAADVRKLARKVALLELEIEAMRRGE